MSKPGHKHETQLGHDLELSMPQPGHDLVNYQIGHNLEISMTQLGHDLTNY